MRLPNRVLHAYGVSTASQIRRLDGTKNSNFRVEDQKTNRVLFVRRRHPDYCHEDWVQYDHRALVHLANRCTCVNTPLRPSGALADQTWFVESGCTYEAHPFIRGNPFDPGDESHIEAAAQGLADLHRAGYDFPYELVKGHVRGISAPGRLSDLCRSLLAEQPEIQYEIAYLREQIEVGGNRLPDASYWQFKCTLNHGDVHPANLIVTVNGDVQGSEMVTAPAVMFVDFDWVGVQPILYDLATALLFLCTNRPSAIVGEDIWSLTQPFLYNLNKMRRFLSAYQRAASLTFDTHFLRALCEQMRLTWAHCRLDGVRKVPRAQWRAFLARDLRAPFFWLDAHPTLL